MMSWSFRVGKLCTVCGYVRLLARRGTLPLLSLMMCSLKPCRRGLLGSRPSPNRLWLPGGLPLASQTARGRRGDGQGCSLRFVQKAWALGQAVQGLSYMVNLEPKIFHRDIRPKNVLLDRPGPEASANPRDDLALQDPQKALIRKSMTSQSLVQKLISKEAGLDLCCISSRLRSLACPVRPEFPEDWDGENGKLWGGRCREGRAANRRPVRELVGGVGCHRILCFQRA